MQSVEGSGQVDDEGWPVVKRVDPMEELVLQRMSTVRSNLHIDYVRRRVVYCCGGTAPLGGRANQTRVRRCRLLNCSEARRIRLSPRFGASKY